MDTFDPSLGERINEPAIVGVSSEGSFEVEIPAVPELMTDRDMIELALSRLIDDACNYPDSATKVRIVTHVEPSGFGESCGVIFEVMSHRALVSPQTS